MPDANISTTHDPTLGSEGNCAWVSGTDPLFDKVADAWMKIMIEDFGTDHWYIQTVSVCSNATESLRAIMDANDLVMSCMCLPATGGRYQCDGFFTGMAPPWYDAGNPASAVTAAADTGSVRAETSPIGPIEADPAWTPGSPALPTARPPWSTPNTARPPWS
jgi:hypothetical protein